jgi:1-acyl-sn-glycerol-3-phosphate acyltransferase
MRVLALPGIPNLKLLKGRFAFDPSPILRKIIHFLTRCVYRPQYIGFSNIPREGPAIIIANHVSYMDGPIIDAGTTRRVRYLIDQDIYHYPVIHYLMTLNRSIPIAQPQAGVDFPPSCSNR